MCANFIFDDPRTTNGSFIEGHSTDESLHCAAYDNDARISYVRGWATSPTSSLTFLVAGKIWQFILRFGAKGRYLRATRRLLDHSGPGVRQGVMFR